ncbi:MAG: serine/threonine-protein kinase, partial [Myxococcota bacterium]
RGVIHRDVKPSNIMVTFDGTAKLIDFGIAVGDDVTIDRVTRTGAFIGSHDFAAPEQLRGETNAIGSWTDTYALGATLYEMLTLHTPFESATFADRLACVDEPPPYTPRHYNARVPSALDSLVNRALHPVADRRFHDGRELSDALRACPTRTSLLPALSTGWLRRLGVTTRAHTWFHVALLASLAAVVFAGLYLTERARALDRQEQNARDARRSAQQVLSWQLETVRGDFEACLPPHTIARPPRRFLLPLIPPFRLEATLTVVRGEVREVEPTGSYGVRPKARTCLLDTLRGMRLPGVGFGEPMTLTVNLRVKPAAASASP